MEINELTNQKKKCQMSRTRYAQVLKFWISLSRYKRKKREKKKELYVSVCFYECLYNQTNKQAKKKKRKKTLTYTSLWKYSLSAFLLFLSVSITCENNLS